MIYCGKKWGVFVKSGGVLTCCHFKNKNDNFLESNLSWFLLADSSMTLSKTISSINCCSIDIMVRFMSCSVSDNIIRPNRTQKKNLTRHVTIRLEKKDQAQKKKNRTTHTFKRTSGRENNWDLYNHQDGISHTQQCCDIKRTQPLFVHRFHIVKNDKIIKQHIDNVYCSAKIKIVWIRMS